MGSGLVNDHHDTHGCPLGAWNGDARFGAANHVTRLFLLSRFPFLSATTARPPSSQDHNTLFPSVLFILQHCLLVQFHAQVAIAQTYLISVKQ